ncbi:hypothetical protein JIQ42_07869 [Leishmania sp. Namibia]|uniref:hypothetical protein n=1 Tax=Leishmania sp. Namibia TaxID=2802991 RepID=UPI001B429425|nr:hypothetical protein JIQ42_07869 [Leishmania sp. Namibia]
MSISSSVTYALLCVYCTCRATLLFMVEMLLFLPSYYLVERHDTPSVWLGRRGEAQVQPVLSSAYQYQKAEERETFSNIDSADMMKMGARVQSLDCSTRDVEDSRCILSRKAVRRIRSLHTAKESSSWWPHMPPSVNPFFGMHLPGTPQSRPQRQRRGLLPSVYGRPSPSALKGSFEEDGRDEEDMNGSQGSWSNYTIDATPLALTKLRPLSLPSVDAAVWRDGSSGGEAAPVSLQSSLLQRTRRLQLPRALQQHPNGGDLDGEDVAYGSFNGRLSATIRDAADGGDQQPCVTDTFFDGLVVSVLVSAQLQQQPRQGSLAAVRKRTGVIAEAEGLLARWSGRQCEAAPQEVADRTASAQALAAAARERLCAAVPPWCAVVFPSPTGPSATRKGAEGASPSFRGQYGFLPPWYAVHARAQLLLALADPLVRIVAELLCCRGSRAMGASPAALTEELDDMGSVATDPATAALPEQQRPRQSASAPLPFAWLEREAWQDVGAFLLRPVLLCFRLLWRLFYTIMRPPGGMLLFDCSTCMTQSPASHNGAAGGGGWRPFRCLEGAMQACIDRYTTDTLHCFESLHTDTAAAATMDPSVAVMTQTGGSVTPAAHVFSQPTPTSAKAAEAARRQAHMSAAPFSMPSTSAPAPACRQSVGVYWLHGRRPPMWSAAAADDLSATSVSQAPPPATVVVLLLCPSLLQGNGLYPHTVARLSHVCQLLTLAGAWRTSFMTEEAATPSNDAELDQAFLLSSRRSATSRKAAQNREYSMDREEALRTSSANAQEKVCAPPLHRAAGSSLGSYHSIEAEVNEPPSPQAASSSPLSATRSATRLAVQWYAAVPVVELRVPATSPERADDISMPPLTLRDLRHVVKQLRYNLELCQPPPTGDSVPSPSDAAGHAARPDALGRLPAQGAAAEVPAAPRPRRPVYIVAVGWSEAASPLLELAITQQQQTTTGNGGSTKGVSDVSSGAQPPARLDGIVCLSHTLSSAFQLLPEKHTEALVLKRNKHAMSSLARTARRVSHASSNSTGIGNGLCPAAPPIISSPAVPATLHAAPHMPRILSHLTTGPARLLCLLTRMQLIADALLAHRQHEEQWQEGKGALSGSGRIFRTAGVRHGGEVETTTQPEYKARKRAGTSPSQVASTAAPCISLYQILHLFREAREEVKRAQRGLDRATITWTHQQQQQRRQRLQARLAQQSGGCDCVYPASTGNLPRVLSRMIDDDAELGIMRAPAAAQPSQPRPLLPSSSSFSGLAFMSGSLENALPQHGLIAAPLFKYVRAASLPGSFESMPRAAASSNAAAATVSAVPATPVANRRDAERETNTPTAPSLTSAGGGVGVPSSSTARDASPSTARRDCLQEPSTLWCLPHLETVTDWEELAKSPMMAEVQQQQRLEAANKTANDLRLPPSVDPTMPLGGGTVRVSRAPASVSFGSGAGAGGRRRFLSVPGAEAEAGRYAASGTLSGSPAFAAGNARRCTWTQMSTDDVIASCTLQVVSPTARHAARMPASGASVATQAAATLRGVSSAGNRGRAAPSLASEPLASEEFNSFYATPSSSPLLFVASPDGGASGLFVMGAESERGNAAVSCATPTSREAASHAPAKSAGPSMSTAPPQLQQPIPYPPPSRAPVLSSQAAALVELRVRSAQHAALIQRIRVPTLLVHARDDPVAPTSTLPFSLLQANPWITTVLTRRGSHAVFMESASEVWRRPRLVVTERMPPADTTLSASSAAVAENMAYFSGSGCDMSDCVFGARVVPNEKPLSASASSQRCHVSSPPPVSPTAGTIPRSPALMAAARSRNPFPPPRTKAKRVRCDGTSSSSTSINNSCSTDDFNDDGDSDAGALVEVLPVIGADADFMWQRSTSQCTTSSTHSLQQHQPVAAAPMCQWLVRIDGTTWLERLLFEYVEKVILCQPSASSLIG